MTDDPYNTGATPWPDHASQSYRDPSAGEGITGSTVMGNKRDVDGFKECLITPESGMTDSQTVEDAMLQGAKAIGRSLLKSNSILGAGITVMECDNTHSTPTLPTNGHGYGR